MFFVAQRRPWTQRQGMPRDPLTFGNSYSGYNNQWQHAYGPPPPWNPPQPNWPNYQNQQWQSPQGGWSSYKGNGPHLQEIGSKISNGEALNNGKTSPLDSCSFHNHNHKPLCRLMQ